MKRVAALFLSFLFLICSASAHPGRTDSSGGHHVSATGEYHYHHGYSAHQHIDGVCPYDFDDKTGQNSGSSSGTSTTGKKGSTASTEANKDPEDKSKSSVWDYILIGFLIVVFGLPVLVFPVIAVVDNAKAKKHKAAQEEENKRRFNEKRNDYIKQYAGKTIEELSDMPPDTEIGEDGLPKTKGSVGWGERYTFYVSRRGKAFHRNTNCNAAAKTKIHACAAYGYSPCKKCKPICPDLNWFRKYRHINSICEFYQINLPVPEDELDPYWAIAPTGEKLYASDPKALQDKIKELATDENTEDVEQAVRSKPSKSYKKVAGIVLIFLTLASLGSSILFAMEANKAAQTIEEQSSTIDKQKEAISALNKQYVSAAVENHDLSDEVETLKAKNNELVKALIEADMERSFWHEYAVIVTSTGNKYHTYDCQHVDGKKFWIYNIDAAKVKGYSPCLDCDPPQ